MGKAVTVRLEARVSWWLKPALMALRLAVITRLIGPRAAMAHAKAVAARSVTVKTEAAGRRMRFSLLRGGAA